MSTSKTIIFLSMCISFLMLYACKHDDITCTDANTSRINKTDTIFVNTCRQVTATTPYSCVFYETQPSEINYGKPLVRITYTSTFTGIVGDCEKGKNSRAFSAKNLYLENLSNRSYTIRVYWVRQFLMWYF